MNNWVNYKILENNQFILKFNWHYSLINYKNELLNRCTQINNPAIMLSGGQDSLLVAHAFHEAQMDVMHFVYKVYDNGKFLNEYEIEFAEQFCRDNKKQVLYIDIHAEQVFEKYKDMDLWLPHPDYFLQYWAIGNLPKEYFLCLGISMPGDLGLRQGEMHFVSSLMGLNSFQSFDYYKRPGEARFLTDTPQTGSAFIFNDFVKQKAKEKTTEDFDFGWKNELYNWFGFNIPKQKKQYIFPLNICEEFKNSKVHPKKWRRFISLPYNTFLKDYEEKVTKEYMSN